MKKKKKCGGFTLVELLIVIAIIGLLISVSLPSMMLVLEMANRVSCVGNLKHLGEGVIQYRQVHDMSFPSVQTAGLGNVTDVGKNALVETPGSITSQSRAWFTLVRDGYAQFGHFSCPNDSEVVQGNEEVEDFYDFPGVDGGPPISYAFQSCLYADGDDTPSWVPSTSSDPEVILAGDMNGLMKWTKGSGGRTWWYAESNEETDLIDDANGALHRGGQNVLYLSGTADWVQTPLVGPSEDNIYTTRSGGGEAAPGRNSTPADKYDVLLMP